MIADLWKLMADQLFRAVLAGCFRNQLLVIDVQLLLAKALAANFDLTGSYEAKFGYNLLLPKSLDRSDQQLITEAPYHVGAHAYYQKNRLMTCFWSAQSNPIQAAMLV